METVPTIQGTQITLRKIQRKDVDDRLVLGRHHEFIHMCGGETLTEPEYPNRDTWVNWYNSAKTADYSWIIDLNGHCIGTAGFHHISEEDNSATYRIGIFDVQKHSKVLEQKLPDSC